MNRQMKRKQERQERKSRGSVAERREAATATARRSAGPTPTGRGEKKSRTGARKFLKEVRQELNKVDWPTRRELVSYTVVVLVTVVVMTSLVFGLDFVFSRVILNVLAN